MGLPVNKKSLLSSSLSLLLASMLLATFWSATLVHAAASWNVQTVDPNAAGRGSNGYCPIVVDSNNVPSIAYTGYDIQDNSALVMYARSLGGFSTQRIAMGYVADMALDAANNPVILCGSGGLQYVTWNGTGWTFQKVADGNYGVLAFDSHGNPHVAYINGEGLQYASRSGTGWTTETVETGVGIPFYLSFAMDSNDKPYMLYSNPTTKIATLENSGWNIQTVPLPAFSSPDSIVGVGNMVLDSKGHPHLIYSIYSVGGDAAIKYVSWTGFSWKTQTLASGVLDDFRFPGVLALDSLDYPHIAYVTAGSELMYAAWTGVDWNIQPVDSAFGRNPVYMAVDSNRIPHISYRIGSINDNTNNLMYATATEPVPLSPPTSAFPLLLVVAAVVIGVAVVAVVVYVWKKKTKH